jgi:BolA protein
MDSLSYMDRIRRKLEAALSPVDLEIVDDSARHIGHAGHNPQGETHFKIKIVSPIFSGLAHVARHRLVYDALREEISERVHALNISAVAPDEIHNHK